MPEETRCSAWTQLIMTEIQNHNVREHQHIDTRSSHELLQDVSTLAAIDAFSNPGMAADANVSRGLRTLVPLSGPVNYRAEDGSKRAMTLAAAKAMEHQRGEVRSVSVVSASYTPPPIDFLVNSNTSNRMHRNGLSAAMMPGSSATATSSFTVEILLLLLRLHLKVFRRVNLLHIHIFKEVLVLRIGHRKDVYKKEI